jgi:hypothetical protein
MNLHSGATPLPGIAAHLASVASNDVSTRTGQRAFRDELGSIRRILLPIDFGRQAASDSMPVLYIVARLVGDIWSNFFGDATFDLYEPAAPLTAESATAILQEIQTSISLLGAFIEGCLAGSSGPRSENLLAAVEHYLHAIDLANQALSPAQGGTHAR